MESKNQKKISVWIMAIITVLILWGGLIAWGAIRTQSSFDLRKPAIILGSIATFVIVWVALLMIRNRNAKGTD